MDGDRQILILFVVASVVLLLLAVPLILRKVPPNGLYGWRTKATLSDPFVWYEVNHLSGVWLLTIGVVTILIAVTNYRANLPVDTAALKNSAPCLVGFIGMVIHGAVEIQRLKQNR